MHAFSDTGKSCFKCGWDMPYVASAAVHMMQMQHTTVAIIALFARGQIAD
jgi:hypothetical protein